jgi:hypothetical protein
MKRILLLIVFVLPVGFLPDANAGQVDLLDYGHIHVGMTEGEVLVRLGPPDLETFEGYTANNAVIKAYYYFSEPERYQQITTLIRFVGGRVFRKERIYD